MLCFCCCSKNLASAWAFSMSPSTSLIPLCSSRNLGRHHAKWKSWNWKTMLATLGSPRIYPMTFKLTMTIMLRRAPQWTLPFPIATGIVLLPMYLLSRTSFPALTHKSHTSCDFPKRIFAIKLEAEKSFRRFSTVSLDTYHKGPNKTKHTWEGPFQSHHLYNQLPSFHYLSIDCACVMCYSFLHVLFSCWIVHLPCILVRPPQDLHGFTRFSKHCELYDSLTGCTLPERSDKWSSWASTSSASACFGLWMEESTH